MVVLVEVARKAYLASIVPVIVNAILNEHQVVVDIVAFVNRGDFPRSRLGEKQRGKILVGWVSRKMRTMAQFAIRDMSAIEGGSGGADSGPTSQPDANRASLSSMRSGGNGGGSIRNTDSVSVQAPPQILEQRELEQQHDLDFGFGNHDDGNNSSEGPPPPQFGAIEMPADDNFGLHQASTATEDDLAQGDTPTITTTTANNNTSRYDLDEYGEFDPYKNEHDALTPTQGRVGVLSVRNADNADSSDEDDDARGPPAMPVGRKPIARKSLHSPPHHAGGAASATSTLSATPQMFLPGVDGRPSTSEDWRLSTAMYGGDADGSGNQGTHRRASSSVNADDEWAREAIRGLSLADNGDQRPH